MPLGAKICGLSESDQIQACVNCGASMCGYILFYPKSHRNLNLDKAKSSTIFDKDCLVGEKIIFSVKKGFPGAWLKKVKYPMLLLLELKKKEEEEMDPIYVLMKTLQF